MFNYNLINPVNIHYRKYPNNSEGAKSAIDPDRESPSRQPVSSDENNNQRRFPNGNKVAIDYTKNQVNISQILQDFRSTISAINSPDSVVEEVEQYLGLVGKESEKSDPSREIVLSNLKNAARITDKYIQDSLKKPSRVVQDWVDALFLQNINLKADPNEVNEEFRVKIPEKKQAQQTEFYSAQMAENVHTGGLKPLNEDTVTFSSAKPVQAPVREPQIDDDYTYLTQNSYIESSYETLPAEEPIYTIDSSTEPVVDTADYYPEQYIEEPVFESEPITPYTPAIDNDELAKEVLLQGKAVFEEGGDIYSTLKLYDEALSLTEGSENLNLKSAIYFERAKIFDSFDYPELALIDYHKATKSTDGNLRAHARIKMGNIYDDYVQIDPAIDQYSLAIEDSEEAENPQGKTKALRCLASLFASIYDIQSTESFNDLALESAKETNNPRIIAKTYMEAAENYRYIGEDKKALQVYASLAQEELVQDDYETLAQNYMEASALMDKKGNRQKSYALMLKSKEYQRLARLRRASLES